MQQFLRTRLLGDSWRAIELITGGYIPHLSPVFPNRSRRQLKQVFMNVAHLTEGTESMRTCLVGGIPYLPLRKNISSSVGMMTLPTEWNNISNLPNHQPVVGWIHTTHTIPIHLQLDFWCLNILNPQAPTLQQRFFRWDSLLSRIQPEIVNIIRLDDEKTTRNINKLSFSQNKTTIWWFP